MTESDNEEDMDYDQTSNNGLVNSPPNDLEGPSISAAAAAVRLRMEARDNKQKNQANPADLTLNRAATKKSLLPVYTQKAKAKASTHCSERHYWHQRAAPMHRRSL